MTRRQSDWTLVALSLSFMIGAFSANLSCKGTEPYCEPDYCADKGGGSPYLCKPTLSWTRVECHFDDTSAFFWCQGQGGTARQPICNGAGGDGTGETGGTETDGDPAPDWSPSKHVTFDPRLGEYRVDANFIGELETNPSLLALDNAYVTPTESGYYQLHKVATGDLAYAMGLRSGDVLLNLNGHELQSLDRVLEAYDDLEHDREFMLTVERGIDLVQFTYVLVNP